MAADVVALQEVTARTLPMWRAALADAGLRSCLTTLDTAPAAAGRRLLGVLTAAREPLRPPLGHGPLAQPRRPRAVEDLVLPHPMTTTRGVHMSRSILAAAPG